MTGTFICSAWTSAGNVVPSRTGPYSPLPLELRIAAVAQAGYDGIAFHHADLEVIAASNRWDYLGDLLQASGMEYLELEYLDEWWKLGGGPPSARKLLLQAARELNVHHIKIGAGYAGDEADPNQMRDALTRLGDEAGAAGTRVGLEANWFSTIGNLDGAVRLIEDVHHDAVGLVLDIAHIFHAGVPYSTITDTVPIKKIFSVELDDGTRQVVGTPLDDTFDNRVLCGDGEFDVTRFIQAVHDLGYQGPFGVEHMNIYHRTLGVHEAVRVALEAAQAAVAGASSSH